MKKFNEWLKDIKENFNFDHNVSDSEHALTLSEKMRDELEKVLGNLEQCLSKVEYLEEQAYKLHTFYDKAGINRVDMQGKGDSDYFEEAAYALTILARPIRKLFGKYKRQDSSWSDNVRDNQVKYAEDAVEKLVQRLHADFEQKD